MSVNGTQTLPDLSHILSDGWKQYFHWWPIRSRCRLSESRRDFPFSLQHQIHRRKRLT
ncbi:hypothetical protein ACC676_08790 [Rhizobium ruizarguesonis]